MYIIYDYFLLIGDKSWYMPPAWVIITKNVDSLERDASERRPRPARRRSWTEPPGVGAGRTTTSCRTCEGAAENGSEENINTCAGAALRLASNREVHGLRAPP